MSTRSVHNDYIEPFLLEFGDTLSSNGYRICLGIRTKVCDFGFGGRLASLVKSTGTKSIGTDYTGLETALLIVNSKLGASRCFAISLSSEAMILARAILATGLHLPGDQQP